MIELLMGGSALALLIYWLRLDRKDESITEAMIDRVLHDETASAYYAKQLNDDIRMREICSNRNINLDHPNLDHPNCGSGMNPNAMQDFTTTFTLSGKQ